MPDYQDRISEARDLLEMAAQTPEGRAAVRRWTGQVAAALPEDEPAAPDPAAEWQAAQARRAAQVQAARDMGYDVALSETGAAGIELYPDVRAGHYDTGLYPGPGPAASPDNNGGTVQYTEAQLRQAQQADDLMRYEMMLRGGPARPRYAGLQLREKEQLPDPGTEDAPATVVKMTHALAASSGQDYNTCAAAVDGEMRERGISPGDLAARREVLVQASAMFPGRKGQTPEEMELSRRRDDDTGTAPVSEAEAPGVVGDLVDRYPGALSHTPRRGQTHLAAIGDESTRDSRQPAAGGVVHPAVARILQQHGALMGIDPNTVYAPKSAAQREREERQAHHATPGRSITELHSQAVARQARRSAGSSRG